MGNVHDWKGGLFYRRSWIINLAGKSLFL